MSGNDIFICSGESGKWVRFDGETFEETTARTAKKGYCAATIPLHMLHSHTFKIPLNIGEEKLETLVEITMYEEGGLDIDKEYVIAHVRHPLDFEASWLVEAFAVEQEALKGHYGTCVSGTGHIDLLAIPYFAYEALYVYEKADAEATELFLYLGEENSFAALYKEGRYLTHRTLPSLSALAVKAGVDVAVLKEALRERGLEKERYAPDESVLITTLQDAFVEMVERIAHTVSHKRGLFGIGKVNTLLLDFEEAEIPGLWELFDGYGFEESRKGAMACCEALPPKNQHEGVEALYLLAAKEERLVAPNLTLFKKRPGFFRTYTGRFTATVAVALLLVVGYGLATKMELDEISVQRQTLRSQLRNVRTEAERLMKKLEAERDLRDETKERLRQRLLELMAYEEAADTMMLIKASAQKRQKMVRDVDEALKVYRLSATAMEQNGSKRMRVDILTRYGERDRIAKFMKRLVDMGYGSVGTREIKLDEDIYQSSVEIVR
jgi:hypothetical protein